MKKALSGLVIATAALSLSGCAVSAQPGTVGVIVDDYAFIPTAPVILGCIPEMGQNTEVVNNVYFYPARQISYDASDAPDAERRPIVVVSSKEAATELKIPVTVTMDLTTDCELLKEFHRRLGTKYNAWMSTANVDTNDGTVNLNGWTSLLNYVVGQPLEVTLTRASQKYPWQAIWNDEGVRLEFERLLNDELPKAIDQRAGLPDVPENKDQDTANDRRFFTGLRVTVLKPEPLNDDLKRAIADQQNSVAKANAARQAADAQVAQAQAETVVANERAKQQRAVISGYPTVEDYLRSLLIDKGGNPWQPTWIAPGVAR